MEQRKGDDRAVGERDREAVGSGGGRRRDKETDVITLGEAAIVVGEEAA